MKRKLFLSAALLIGMQGEAHALDLSLANARFTVPLTTMSALRFAQTLRQQYDFSCGSAALATLLTYHYGHPVSEQQVFAEMYLRGDQRRIRARGFSLLDMRRFLAVHGFQADGFELPLERLLESGLPALVLIAEKDYHHFVIIKGIRDGRVLLGDPSRGTRALPLHEFVSLWQGKLLFVIHGYRGKQVRFNDANDWLAAPAAPLSASLPRDLLHTITLPRNGPGDF